MAKANPKYEESLKSQIKLLPHKPGVYKYFDEKGKIIYVGKAKNLKNRVSSYFNRDTAHGGKITLLVRKIAKIEFIIVESEVDALLLENNLIKELQPRYNVMMKDDKTYPWIVIKNERFPRVFSTRNIYKDGSQYFGPYASGRMMHTILDLIRQLYPLRTCKFNLSKENIDAGKYKVCLEYHIDNCKGPCENLQSEEEYNQYIEDVKHILKGNIGQVKKYLKDSMIEFAQKQEFEKAQLLKEKIEILEKYQSKSTVINPKYTNMDVFSMVEDDSKYYVNYLRLVDGAVVQSHSVEIKAGVDEDKKKVLIHAILDLRERLYSNSKEVLIPFEIDAEIPNVKISIPLRGDKKSLIDLSERNAKFFMLDTKKRKSLVDPERHTKRILSTLKKDLRLKEEPRHIECFDNSNIQGNYAVAACVVFRNAKPYKKDYRHFNIKTVEGPDDFASMKEVVGRRYKRLLEENISLPQLIIIDGGKGQLNAAVQALEELGLRGKIAIIGIAKRLEEIFYPGDKYPLYLDKKSESLKVIQHARDEAHRFGITHYRGKHQKEMKKTELESIKGIGAKTADDLLKKFKSVKRIKELSLEELKKEIGLSKAQLIFKYFKNNEKTNI